MSKPISAQQVFKSVKLVGLFAIMATLIGSALISGNTASAASLVPAPATPVGKLSVATFDAASGKIIVGATVLVVNDRGERVAKGLTNNTGIYEIKTFPATYKVTVFADNHKDFGQVVTLSANQVTTIKAGLAK